MTIDLCTSLYIFLNNIPPILSMSVCACVRACVRVRVRVCVRERERERERERRLNTHLPRWVFACGFMDLFRYSLCFVGVSVRMHV
jgi:hypothetical protein